MSFTINRGAGLSSFSQSYTSPATVIPGTYSVTVTFFASAGGTGSQVAVGSETATVGQSGGSLGTFALTNAIQKVAVSSNQLVMIDETLQLVATPTDASGNIIAVTPGSFTWTSANGSNISVTPDGVATGNMVGSSQVSASVDGVTGSGTVVVSATGSASPSAHNVGTQVQSWYQWGWAANTYEQLVKVMAAIGFTTMRLDAHWDEIEVGTTGQVSAAAIQRYRTMVAIGRKYGMTTIFVTDTTTDARPSTEWGSTPDGSGGFPNRSADLTAFCSVFTGFAQQLPGTATVDNFNISVGSSDFVLECGNESNLFCSTTAQAASYATVVIQLKQSLVAAGVTTKLGAAAVTTWKDGDLQHVSSTAFISACGNLPVDFWSFHAYCGNAAPGTLSGTISQVISLFKTYNPAIPIYCTESGYPTSTDGNGVSTALQATYDLQTVQMLFSAGVTYVGVYKAVDDDSTNDPEPDFSYGVTNSDLSRKPSATALNSYLVPATPNAKRAIQKSRTRALVSP